MAAKLNTAPCSERVFLNTDIRPEEAGVAAEVEVEEDDRNIPLQDGVPSGDGDGGADDHQDAAMKTNEEEDEG